MPVGKAHPFAGGLVLAPPEAKPLAVLNAAAARDWRPARRVPDAPSPRPAASPPPATTAARFPQNSLRRVYAQCGLPIAVNFAPPALARYVAPRFDHSRDDFARAVATLTLVRANSRRALDTP